MAGWWDSLFGSTPSPAHPASRGALLGAGYQGMPDTRASITDIRKVPFDQAAWMRGGLSTADAALLNQQGVYKPSMHYPASFPTEVDPMTLAANAPSVTTDVGSDIAPYKSSFQQNMPPPRSVPAPYQRFPVGPNLPRGPTGTSVDPEMPYMGQHLPISPGDPGWTPPPSPSGPHNPGGDPARPGYGNPMMPMDLSSIPGTTLNSVPQGWQ